MKNFLKGRKIDTLYHFTQADNLVNIFKYGLLPREILEDEDIHSNFNDNYRYDGCLDAVCMSIEFPNYKMFYNLRKNIENADWVVLKLDAQLLCDFKCAYCWTNAGSSMMYNTPIEEKIGIKGVMNIFSNVKGYPLREETGIPDRYPTNPQAEVLVFGTVPTRYIESVFFENVHILEKYKNIIPSDINSEVNYDVFSYRCDWNFW